MLAMRSYQAQQAVAYLNSQLSTVANQPSSPLITNNVQMAELDPYALALLANALIAVDPQDQLAVELLNQLVARASESSDGYFSWQSGTTTYMGGYGDASNIETSAMMVLAALRSGRQTDAAQKAIDGLVTKRNGDGYYYSTQTTVLVLKALLLAAKQGGEGKNRHRHIDAQSWSKANGADRR